MQTALINFRSGSEILIYNPLLTRDAIARALRETRPAGWPARGAAFLLVRSLMAGDHTRIRQLTEMLAKISQGGERYYLALSYFLTGDYEQSLALLERIPTVAVDPADVAILKAQVLTTLCHRQEAWQTLDQAMQSSHRLKLYSVLADLVTTEDEFSAYENLVSRGCNSGKIAASTLSLVEYRIKAALRARQYEFALRLSINDYRTLVRATPRKRPIQSRAGKTALAHLGSAIDRTGSQFFLISGTLLGAIREQRILPHDNDLDVGIWAEDDQSAIKEAVIKSGYFFCMSERSPWTLRVRHVNGVSIDIFRHFREDTYWHGGVKAKWHNSPFSLRWINVLGGRYLIPDNFELYLTENYGNWMRKVVDFDSVFHAPNAEIINDHECAVHCVKEISALEVAGKAVDDNCYFNFLRRTFNTD